MAEITTPQGGTTWVVGVDGSDDAAHALSWATSHAPGRTTRLQLVAAWLAPSTSSAFAGATAGAETFDRNLLADGAQRLVDVAADGIAPIAGIAVEPVIAHGGPSAVLLDAAEHADLLVVGSRGEGGFKRLLLGSTSTQCATHATGPTVVVPAAAHTEPTADIVVGIDGSHNSIAALRWALCFAQPGTRVEALSVWDVSPIAVGADQFFFPEATDLAEERFHHLIDTVVTNHAGAAELHVKRTFMTGTARREIAKRSESTDLLVLGARGHGAIGAALIGSVSTWSLHHASSATVIVPASAR